MLGITAWEHNYPQSLGEQLIFSRKQKERGKFWPVFWFQEPFKISLPCYFRCPRWPLLLLNTPNAGRLNLFFSSSSLLCVWFLWMLLFSKLETKKLISFVFLGNVQIYFCFYPEVEAGQSAKQVPGSSALGLNATDLVQRLLVSFQGQVWKVAS